MGGVFHVVQFKFKSGIGAEKLKDICDQMLGLRQKCIHPTTQKPYIKVSYGGKENSVEGLHDGYTHIFIVEFDSTEDRTYYALKDPAHSEYSKLIGSVAAQVHVVDFTDGVYE
ncbi:unnamed protein product [Clonostachys solani]|uniref:Stress-response A/B barrel domain-containing protein n=1 Tax=Clonostachys solani TaxID=160281 RepID=A0A9P0EG09_9HYPO|nr:unnamed protein product [Clonostachys solani]